MPYSLKFLVITLFLVSCVPHANRDTEQHNSTDEKIKGTWKLTSVKTIINNDTTIVTYSNPLEGIKIIGETHFSFFQHDLNKGKDSTAIFNAGGGKYTLQGNQYTEFLEYCSAREWENNKFDFTIEIRNDSLFQTGKEKINTLGIDRTILETYIRANDSNTPVPIYHSFDTTEVSWFADSGSGSIHGSAKFKSKDGEIYFGEEFWVELMPASNYTQERLTKIYNHDNSGSVYIEDGIPRFIPDPKEYHKTKIAKCDEQGSFSFDNLPKGTYYLIAFMLWENKSSGKKNGGGIMAKTALKENESKEVILTNF